eukprot:CAMPEP_0196587172 /NCGR_PEP_ID=MMETSP1081-20130531/56648_1 /TAXON_ID=36882 /ORGANISM="Pyramimonas amylifera, Strain CCMP720" /LENGTH=118 /DNA_ID=CAMNT_0041909277 /DNA_START=99 /DNA_END=452 /DNA_ORIENTATION=-
MTNILNFHLCETVVSSTCTGNESCSAKKLPKYQIRRTSITRSLSKAIGSAPRRLGIQISHQRRGDLCRSWAKWPWSRNEGNSEDEADETPDDDMVPINDVSGFVTDTGDDGGAPFKSW